MRCWQLGRVHGKVLKTNVIMLFPGASFGRGGVASAAGEAQSIEMEDVNAIRDNCPSVKYISPVARSSGQIIAGNNNWNSQVYGVYPEYMDIRAIEISDGEMFTDVDERRTAKVCIVGTTCLMNTRIQ